ncbi:MAG: FlgD immunoglobulin-like domain containing protein, partial [Candidatus Zixiibacteriota bacterium]
GFALSGVAKRCASHKKIAGMAQLALASPSISKEGKKLVQIDAKFEVEAAGVQLELTYDPEKIRSIIPELTDRTKDLQLFFGAHDGVLKIGIIDLIGEHLIPAGDGALVSLSIAGSATSSLELKKAILVDEKATPFEVAILPKEETSATRPKEFALMQNYPNPFNPETEISYTLPHDSHVKLVIYNVKGQKVKTLVEEYQAAGHKTVRWDGTDDNGNKLASGIYFYRLQAGDFVQSKKMVLMK